MPPNRTRSDEGVDGHAGQRPNVSRLAAAPVSGAPFLVLALLTLSTSPAIAQMPWQTMDWEVTCTLELEGLIHATAEERASVVEEWLRSVDASGPERREAATRELDSQLKTAEQCFEEDPVGIRQLAEDQLETSSRWLGALGFGGPAISPWPADEAEGLLEPERSLLCAGRYCAAIDLIPHAHGQYSPEDMYLRLGLRWPRAFAPDGHLTPSNATVAYSPTHELFHAIQFGYRNGIPPETPGLWRWLLEGTSELVERVAAERWGTATTPSAAHRYYDDALHVPPTTEDQSVFNEWAYGSWYFWDYLGHRLGSPDRVQYLHEVLAQDLSASNGLVGVDRALKGLGTQGLYDLYPAFVANRLRESRFFRSLAGDESGACTAPRLDLALRDSVRISSCPTEMAAEAFFVTTTVPQARLGALKIRIPRGEDDPAYHLVVGGDRLDVVDQLIGEYPAGERNVFVSVIPPGRDSVLVRVVNVPEKIDEVSTGGMNFITIPLDVVLSKHSAEVRVTGSENGNLDGVLFSYIHSNVNPQAVAREVTPGLAERYADHAGLDTTTEQGRQAREQIWAAIAEAQPPLDSAALAPPAGEPAECTAIITVFNDEERAVARIVWRGGGPLLDGEHEIQGTHAHGLHDAIYAHIKQVGQELALMDDPEALATWGAEFQGLTIPGVRDLYRQEGAGDPLGLLAQLASIPLMEPHEGRPPPPRPGQESMGRAYDEGGGKLWMAESHGEKVQGAFRFTASGESGTVAVEGEFTAIPGPIVSRLLRSGCEDLPNVLPSCHDSTHCTRAPR